MKDGDTVYRLADMFGSFPPEVLIGRVVNVPRSDGVPVVVYHSHRNVPFIEPLVSADSSGPYSPPRWYPTPADVLSAWQADDAEDRRQRQELLKAKLEALPIPFRGILAPDPTEPQPRGGVAS